MNKYGRVTAELKNLPDDEPVFIIRGKDALAPMALAGYASLLVAADIALEATGNEARYSEMLDEIEAVAAGMIAWQAENADKVRLPD